jgi:chitodextrinase
MAVPGPGLSLIPEDGATKDALATQLHCWARMDNGLTDPRVEYLTCKANGYFYLPPSICADYGPLPFTSEGNEIVCDPDATHQMDRTIWPEDVAPLNVDTCTPEGVQLSAPTNLAVTDITDTGATVSWNAVPGASGYELQYRAAGGEWSAVEELTDPTFDLTGLDLGTSYQVRVRAVGEDGYQPSPYATIGFTTASEPPPEPLPTPAGLAAGSPTDTTVPLTWDATDGADGYNVRYSVSGEDDWTVVAAGSDPEFEVTNLDPETAYDFQVQATDSTGVAGDSEWSASVTATTAGEAPPEPLPIPAGLAAGTPTATTIPFTWDATDGADGYNIQYSLSGTDTWTQVAAGAGTSFEVPGLTAETAYDFQIQATDSTGVAGDSEWSASVTATTAAETPEAATASSASGRRGRRSAS